MRTFFILAAGVFCASQLSFASSACVSHSLADYIALGSGGCTIGTNTLSNFGTLTGITGATPISPAGISLSPSGSTPDPELAITVNASANAGTVLEAFFTYQISGNPFVGSAIELTGSSETGDGAVTGIENFCANGAFGPDGVSGCTGNPGDLLTLDGFQNADAASFSAANLLNITDDFTIDGGVAGSASAGTLSNRFSTIPEPGSIFLAAAGFIGIALIRRKLTERICS